MKLVETARTLDAGAYRDRPTISRTSGASADVIRSGYVDGRFLSSHRLISVMRRQCDGLYGNAADQVARSHIITDC